MKKITNKQFTFRISLAIFGFLAIGLAIGLAASGGTGFQLSNLFGGNQDVAVSKLYEHKKELMEYQYNMLKNPLTGKIPEGSFDGERAQAREILEFQRQMKTPDFASYSFVGPDNLGGRTRTVVYDVRYNGTTNRTMLAGAVSGGVYKSVDDGATWNRKSSTGDYFSCTSIAQDPRLGFQDTWYYAVGEPTGNSASAEGAEYLGNGVYKSTDSGETWARLPNSNTGALETLDNRADYIIKIVVNPIDGSIYIAALGAIIRSIDNGSTWTSVLSAGNNFGGARTTDIVVTSGGVFYAAFSGANDPAIDGVHKSTDGTTWTRIAGAGSATNPAGWNARGAYGRVVLAIAPNLESRVYALYHDNTSIDCDRTPKPEAELFYWNDSNASWTDISATLPDEPGCDSGVDPFAVQGGYDLVIAVKPNNADTIFIGGTSAYRSTNAGLNWTRVGGYANPVGADQYVNSHADIHSFVFQPGSPETMICGNDGGMQRTTNNLAATVAWTPINNGFRTYQYVHVVNDPRNGNNKVMGGAQDNGTTRNIGGTGSAFEPIYSGDGVSVGLSDPAVTGGVQYEYVGFQNSGIARRTADQSDGAGTRIIPTGVSGGLFVTLFKLDPDNTERLYYVNKNKLYRTTSASTVTSSTWTEMTGIETAVGTRTTMEGEPPVPVVTPIKITAIGLSRGAYNAATSSLFFGTEDGRLFRLDDPTGVAANTAPVNITGANFPAGAYVSSISTSPVNDDTALVTFSNYGVNSVFYTDNANAAAFNRNAPPPIWTNVENNLTLPSYRSSAILNIGGTLEYFVGTSAGLFRITGLPAAGNWVQEGSTTIGNAVVSSLDLRVSDNKLLVGTHGIGMLASSTSTSANASISGKVGTASGLGIKNARVVITLPNGEKRMASTNSFGYYRVSDLAAGETYVVQVNSKRFSFANPTRVVSLNGNLDNYDFIAEQ